MKKIMLTFVALGMSIAIVHTAIAQTQVVCDDLDGVAFGLCNAYYAQSCDTNSDQFSCQRILENLILNLIGTEDSSNLCPCFDDSDIPGQGIDFEVQVLNDAYCFDDYWPDAIELFGQRTVDLYLDWTANAALAIDGLTEESQCLLRDLENDIRNFEQGIDDLEVAACIAILVNSQMFKLNNCTP